MIAARRKPLLAVLGLFSFFGILYLTTGNQIFVFDALTNAIACEAGEPRRWFHSNHIFYPFFGMIWYRFERLLGYTGYAVYSLERFNSLLTVSGLCLLYRAASKFASYKKIWVLPFFLGSTYAVWYFAVDGYTMGAVPFFQCLLLWYLCRLVDRDILSGDILILVFLSYLYVGVHALGFFHCLAVAWWLSVQPTEKTWKLNGIFLNKGVQYLTLFVLTVFFSYLLIYFSLEKTFKGFITWSMGYAGYYGMNKVLDWPAIDFRPFPVIAGHWEGWIGMFLFCFRGGFVEKILQVAVALISFALVLWALVERNRLSDKNKKLFLGIFLIGVVNCVVVGFWIPGDVGYRLHMLPPFFLAAAIVLGDRPVFIRTLFVVGSFLFAFNFSGPIYHDSFISNNVGYRLLSEVDQHLEANDVFVCSSGDIPGVQVLRSYFFPNIKGGAIEGRLFEFREDSLEPMKKSLQAAFDQKRSVYVTESLLQEDFQRQIEQEFGLAPEEMRSLLDSVNLTYRFQLSNGTKVYQAVYNSVIKT